jgi:23S rRNA pseudouridine2605 synthase
MAAERVQKILAKAGIASRRAAEDLITEGAVTINGKIAQLGDKAELGSDAIKVNGKLLFNEESKIYLAFYKPRGVISMMTDPEGRPTLADYLTKVKSRLFPVGRLDFNSAGLILLTNDGDFAEKLQKSPEIPRVYDVKVRGHLTPEGLNRLEKGAKIEFRYIKPHRVRLGKSFDQKSKVEVVMMGGGAVDLKTYFEMKGFLVEMIVRTSVGHLTLHGLKAGEYKFLKASQVEALITQPELGMRLIDHPDRPTPKMRTAPTSPIQPVAPSRGKTPVVAPRRAAAAGAIRPRTGGSTRISPVIRTGTTDERESRDWSKMGKMSGATVKPVRPSSGKKTVVMPVSSTQSDLASAAAPVKKQSFGSHRPHTYSPGGPSATRGALHRGAKPNRSTGRSNRR